MRHLTVPSRVVFGILLVFLVSCGTGHDTDEKYFLISTNVKIPYWQAGSTRPPASDFSSSAPTTTMPARLEASGWRRN